MNRLHADPTLNGQKIRALYRHLDTTMNEAYEALDNGDYLVLTDEEANELAKERIEQSLGLFNAHWLVDYISMPYEAIKRLSESMYEDAGPIFLKCCDDFDGLVEDAIAEDGRGHFISSYDSEEHEEGEFFIYRLN